MLLSLKWNFFTIISFKKLFVPWSVLKAFHFVKKNIHCSRGVQWYMNILMYWSFIDEIFLFWNFIHVRNRRFQNFDWNNNLMTIEWLFILSLITVVNHKLLRFKQSQNEVVSCKFVISATTKANHSKHPSRILWSNRNTPRDS